MIICTKLNCHSAIKYYGLSCGSSACINNIGTSFMPEVNVTATIINAGTSILFQSNFQPAYTLYIGLGLSNLVQFQCGFSNQIKFRIRLELPVLSDFPIWKISPKSWEDRLNLLIQYQWVPKQSVINHLGFGISYLLN